MFRPEEVVTGVEITNTEVGTDSLAESESDISVDTLDISPRQVGVEMLTHPKSKQYHLLNINSVSTWPPSAHPLSNKYKQFTTQIISKYCSTDPSLSAVCIQLSAVCIYKTDKLETKLPTDRHS